jgi:hypothetical protein
VFPGDRLIISAQPISFTELYMALYGHTLFRSFALSTVYVWRGAIFGPVIYCNRAFRGCPIHLDYHFRAWSFLIRGIVHCPCPYAVYPVRWVPVITPAYGPDGWVPACATVHGDLYLCQVCPSRTLASLHIIQNTVHYLQDKSCDAGGSRLLTAPAGRSVFPLLSGPRQRETQGQRPSHPHDEKNHF